MLYQRLAFICSILLHGFVNGGPDGSVLPDCEKFFDHLEPHQLREAEELIQNSHSIESHLKHLRVANALRPPLKTTHALATFEERVSASNAQNLESFIKSAGAGLSPDRRAAAAALATSCLSSRLRPHNFPGRPLVSFLLNYFERPQALARLVAGLRAACTDAGVPCELVANVDNPHEAAAWAAEAEAVTAVAGGSGTTLAAGAGVPAFVVVPVFSANLHEARGYNRAARLARGPFLVIWQDDQIPPPGGRWLGDLLRLFAARPAVAILGLNSHRLCRHRERTNRRGSGGWAPDPATGLRWTFAQAVDFAPLAVRASAFRVLGGLDEGISRPGECGILADWELCSRAWMAGWQVGAMQLEGRVSDGRPGSSHLGPGGVSCWGRQRLVARKALQKRYGVRWLLEAQCCRVWLLNMVTFQQSGDGRACPYGGPETVYGNCTLPPFGSAAASTELALAAEAAALTATEVATLTMRNNHDAYLA